MILLAKTLAITLIVLAVILSVCLFFGLAIWSYRRSAKQINGTQRILSDRDLLLIIAQESDGMMTAKRLAQKTELTESEANARLTYLHSKGLMRSHYTGGFKAFYSLKDQLDDQGILELSGKPYLTVDDVLLLFKQHDYRLTAQQLIMSTGLPLSVILEEFKYFKKQKVVEVVYTADPTGMTVTSQIYLLTEPYRNNPDDLLQQESVLNLQLEKIYAKQYREDELL